MKKYSCLIEYTNNTIQSNCSEQTYIDYINLLISVSIIDIYKTLMNNKTEYILTEGNEKLKIKSYKNKQILTQDFNILEKNKVRITIDCTRDIVNTLANLIKLKKETLNAKDYFNIKFVLLENKNLI